MKIIRYNNYFLDEDELISISHQSNKGLLYNKERKHELSNKCLISCPFCRYHKGENSGHRIKRTDIHKNIDRKSIRFSKEKTNE